MLAGAVLAQPSGVGQPQSSSEHPDDAGVELPLILLPEEDDALKPRKLPFEMTITGNSVLTTDVYLAVLDLPQNAKPDATTAGAVEKQFTDFLKRSGYLLAAVVAVPIGNTLYVTIDEGRLEKIVFRGRLTFPMVRLRLALDLPRDTFNQPAIERQLTELSKSFNIEMPKWELIRSQTVRHLGPQLTDLSMLGTISGEQLVRPQQPYELHLFFTEQDWSTGPGIDVRSSYFDGFELGVNYQGKSALWGDDRWRAGLMAGLGLRNDIEANRLYVFPSRVFAEVEWFTPALDSTGTFRPFVLLTGQGNARQRRDLNLENYYSTTNEVSLNLSLPLAEWLAFYTGFGVQHFLVFGARSPPGTEPTIAIDAGARLRTFIETRFEATFESGEGRWDRRHSASIDGRLYANLRRPDQPTFFELHGLYQKVFPIGWHDVWIRGRGTWLTGDVLFPFEEPLGDHLRAVFGDIFVRAAAGIRGEFRFSLTRDLYKIGVFLDTAVYGEQNRDTGTQRIRYGAAFGPSFHALIEGMFQMDLALSFGVISTGRFNTGVHATLIKIF